MFEETREFDSYIAEYNRLPATERVRQLGYDRIGFTNTVDGRHFTLHLLNGKIVKAVHGLDRPDFVASGSLERIRAKVMARQYADLRSEISVPWAVKLKLVKLLWSG